MGGRQPGALRWAALAKNRALISKLVTGDTEVLDQLDGHDRRGALMTPSARDVGDLTTKDGSVHRLGEVVPGLADR